MKQLTHNLAAKVTAIFLFVLSVIGFICGLAGIYYLAENKFYEASVESVKEEIFENISRSYADEVFYGYYGYFLTNKEEPYDLRSLEETFSVGRTNFLFTLKDKNGEIVLSNYTNQEIQFSHTYRYEEGVDWHDETKNSTQAVKGESYTIDCFVKKTLTAEDRYSRAEYWIHFAYSMRYAIIVITTLLFLIAIVLFIFLMCAAGHKKGKTEVIPNGIDKIPFDVFLAALLIIVSIAFAMLNEYQYISEIGYRLFLGLFLVLSILLFLLACMSFATRYKSGGWWKNTILYRFLYFNYRVLQKIIHGIKYLLQNASLLWKTILGLLALSMAEFFVIVSTSYGDIGALLILWLLEKMIFVPIILYIIINLQNLQIGSQKIARGDLNYRIDTSRLIWDFKRHGENLNNISVGMSKAVEERLKSERFKTELITNVSHDIKTPLTSIINYVDLIKREEMENRKIKEYIDVLDRQSIRLKKLIEDLMEVSKASTGNLAVNSSRTEVGVLLTQTIGEYGDKMKNSGLELILKQPEEEIFIMADGRLMWRVFDNLMNNICKYSQPGTRAYLNLEKIDERVVITFRNISKYALNITSDELMERFVRGDSARTTEGSGLGLSIAKSLVELQKGELDLVVDGDLFKVVLVFHAVQ